MTTKRWAGVVFCALGMIAEGILGDITAVNIWSAAAVVIIMTSEVKA